MKKLFLSLVVMTALCVGFVSCGDKDEENNSSGGSSSASIVGKWKLLYEASNPDEVYDGERYLTFKEDGTGIDVSHSGDTETFTKTFTWSLSNNVLTRDNQYSYTVVKLTKSELQISFLGLTATYKRVN